MEIDKNHNIYLSEKSSGDENKSGQFNGRLCEVLFNELINILKTSNLKTWSFPEKEGHDGATVTLIMYYNGKRTYFKSMFPPTISHQLISFLNGLNDRIELTRTDERRTLEK